MFYLTTENAYGHRFLFRCYSTSDGFISEFVRCLRPEEEARGRLISPARPGH